MNTRLLLVLAAAGGVGYYFYSRNKYVYQVGQAMAPAPLPKPSVFDLLLGGAVKHFSDIAKAMDDKMKLRGDVHYTAWKEAVQRGDTYYAIGDLCFVTKTGEGTSYSSCLSKATPGVLE